MSLATVDLLTSRGLDPELAAKLGLESLPRNGGGEELVFPFVVAGEVVNHKYRTPDKQFRQDRGAVKCFWNFDVIADPALSEQPLIITEGEFDAIAALQSGFARTVSVPDGAPAKSIGPGQDSRKYDYLDHARPALRGIREIILATDGDEAGVALMNNLTLRLGKERCKWVRYPKGCKDLNDALRRYGERGVQEVIARAEWIRVDVIYRMSEFSPVPARPAVSTGIEALNPHYRVRLGDFCVITGIPGHGKTTFVNDVLCRLAWHLGWRIAVASFEQHPQSDHRRALREWYLRLPLNDSTGRQLPIDDEIAQADQWIDEHFVFIVPSDDDLANLNWILENARPQCPASACR